MPSICKALGVSSTRTKEPIPACNTHKNIGLWVIWTQISLWVNMATFFVQCSCPRARTYLAMLLVSPGTISPCWHCLPHFWSYPTSWPVGVAVWASSWPTALTWAFGSHRAFTSFITTSRGAPTDPWLACTCRQSSSGCWPSVVGLLVFQR